MEEVFAKPCVGALITKHEGGETFLLIQTRQKEGGGDTNGMLELPAGKIREYEDIFSALRREVKEETGLTITRIEGEAQSRSLTLKGITTVSYRPYCITQNLSGAYSIILHTFLCEAQGEPLSDTDESEHIHWMKSAEVKTLVEEHPERVFFMHLHALRKYLLDQ